MKHLEVRTTPRDLILTTDVFYGGPLTSSMSRFTGLQVNTFSKRSGGSGAIKPSCDDTVLVHLLGIEQ